MSSNPAKPFLVSRGDDPQLQLLNEKIARLAGCKPAGDAFGAFPLDEKPTEPAKQSKSRRKATVVEIVTRSAISAGHRTRLCLPLSPEEDQ